MKKMITALVLLLTSTVVLFSIWSLGQVYYYEQYIGHDLRQRLGFQHGTPYVSAGSLGSELLTVDEVVPGGIFERAGFCCNDVILNHSVASFYKTLDSNRGKEPVVFDVAAWDPADPAPDINEQRKVLVMVPD